MPSFYGELAWWAVIGTVLSWFAVPHLYHTMKGRGGGADFMALYLVVASTLIGIGVLTWCFVRARHPYPGLREQGRCPHCGYDLRATPEKGGALLDRCPECGAVPTAAK